MGPLTGLKVLDLTHVMAGPTCTLMLADMGADVIKVERPPHGDDTRRMVPPSVGDEAASFLMMNRNKRGLALDLKTEGGRTILKRLAARTDVLVENFGPGVTERLGFGYEVLKTDNPGLIYCSLSGFGRTGIWPGSPVTDSGPENASMIRFTPARRRSGPVWPKPDTDV